MIRFLSFNNMIMVDFLGLALVYFVVFLPLWKKREKPRLWLNSIMYLYISLIFYVTLMPIICKLPYIFDHPYVSMSMVPFEDYFLGRTHAVSEIILNVIMMIPFGFLLPMFNKRNLLTNAFIVIFSSLLFSLFIELSQPFISPFRTADITDLITNTTGGFLGYLLYALLNLFKKLTQRISANDN